MIITPKPRRNGRHVADNILRLIFVIENVYISIQISLECVTNSPINKNVKNIQPIPLFHDLTLNNGKWVNSRLDDDNSEVPKPYYYGYDYG